MKTELIEVRTGKHEGVFNLTPQCQQFAAQASGGGDGLLHVFVPHATAGLAVLEVGAHSDDDLLATLAALLPAFLAPFATLPVTDGSMAMGQWQSVVLVDVNVDNPVRQVRLSFLG